VKLSKRKKWTMALCLVTVGCWAVCAYLMYLGFPGVTKLVFAGSAVSALVALGVSEREWPFSSLFKGEVAVTATVQQGSQPNQLAPEAPAFLRGARADQTRNGLWAAFASTRPRHRQVQVPKVIVEVGPVGGEGGQSRSSVAVHRAPTRMEVVHRPQ